jgi:hypothetical protein
MPDKKPPKTKPQLKPSLTQKERFIEYAKEVEADESGETFERALDKITKAQPPK